MKINKNQTENFYIKLNSAFAFIFILVVVASSFGMYILYDLGQVINTTEKETFPATLAAMRLSERTALIAASAPVLAAASNENEIKNIYAEFEKHMQENRSDLQSLYKMGDQNTLTAVKNSLDKVSIIETSLREMVKDKFDLSENRHKMLNTLLKLQADLDDTLGPLIWGTASLTKLLGKRTARMITQNINKGNNIEEIRTFITSFTDTALDPLQTALDIKAETALLMSLLNMAMHVSSPDDIFPLENRAARSLNVFLQASKKFDKGELSKRNPVLSVNLSRIEKSFMELTKSGFNPFDIRRKEIEKELSILSLINQGRQEAQTLSQKIELIVKQVQDNLHHQAELVSKRRLTGVSVLVAISIVSLLLSFIVANLTARALRNRDTAIQQAVVEAERANRIKSQFLANMSHEIRTPMNSVLGFLELVLEDDTLTNDQYKQLSTAYGSAKGLLSLINDILDMNKLESGKVVIEHQHFSLNKLIEQIFQIMDIKAREKGIAFNYSIHDSLCCVFSGDPLRIRQVVINLVGNAIKFTHKGSVSLKVMQEGMVKDDTLLHFTIQDTGIGINSERIAHIFEPFTQADSSTTRKYGGTGLGTTISKQIVELMNGQIWVESEEGKGSIFHFTIPLKKIDEPLMNYSDSDINDAAYSNSNNQSFISSSDFTNRSPHISKDYRNNGSFKAHFNKNKANLPSRVFNILVAEDVEANALLVRTRLKLQKHEITLAKNGLEAVEAFKNNKFDIILMDVHMPVMDGIEATKLIREIESGKGGHIPIVALTASVMKEETKRFIKSGMDFFVAKPIDFNELSEVMDKYVLTALNQESGKDKDGSEEETSGQSAAAYQEDHNITISEQNMSEQNMSEQNISEQNINFEAGLNRWQDIKVYIGSLLSFSNDYGNIMLKLEELLDNTEINQDKIEQAYKITHAVKGVASNLSLINVSDIVMEINSLLYKCKNGESAHINDIKNRLPILSRVLRSTVNEIELLKIKYLNVNQGVKDKIENKDSAADIGGTGGIENNKNIEIINSIINKLEQSIDQYNTDEIDPLIEELEKYISPEHLKAVKKYIDDLDFGAAGAELNELKIMLYSARASSKFFS